MCLSFREVILTSPAPKLPAIHCEVAPRIVRTASELNRLRYVNAIECKEPQYFLDADGQWYNGTVKGVYNRSNWLERTIFGRDYFDAEICFERMEECPFSKGAWFRYMCEGLWLEKKEAKAQRDIFRTLTRTEEIIDWMVQNGRFMRPFK